MNQMSSSKQGDDQFKRGAWSKEEDEILSNYVKLHGHGKWRRIAKCAGLNRCGKSCRLRWLNYLRPDIKRGDITVDEEDLIIRLHKLLGNRWSLIAGRLPGRTDNEIKNYWNTKLMKKHNNKTRSSLSGCNNNTIIPKSKEEDLQKTRELDTPKALAVDDNHASATLVKNDAEKMDLLPVSLKQEGGELETNKVINLNGVINFLSTENNVNFLADIGCSFSSFPDLDYVACSSAWGYINNREEDDATANLHDVEMNMDYNGDGGDLTLLDIEIKKLASLLDLDDEEDI